jgi:hypothetical protein
MYRTGLNNNEYTVILFPDDAYTGNIIEQYENYPHLFYAATCIDIISYVDPNYIYFHFSIEKTSTYGVYSNPKMNYYGVNKLLLILNELNKKYKELNNEYGSNKYDIINILEFYKELYDDVKQKNPEALNEIFKNSDINYYKMLFNNTIAKPKHFFYDS